MLDVAGAPKGVKAKAGILVDATTGQVLWAQGENAVRPIASITKVMTALVVLQAGGLNRKLTVPKAVTDYVAKYGANAAGLIPGQVFTVDELMHAMLIVSAADAAYTLASAYGPGLPAFIAKMNAEAAKLGLSHTHFTSPDGLPVPDGDLHLLHPGRARAARRDRDGLPGVPLDRGAAHLQPAEGRRPQRLLLHLLQRADRQATRASSASRPASPTRPATPSSSRRSAAAAP